MISRAARLTFLALAGLFAGVTIAAVLVAWRVSSGPVSLMFARDAIADLVNDESAALHWQFSDVVLHWGGWDRGLDIRLIDVVASTRDGDRVGQAPAATVAVSMPALAEGVLAAQAVHVYEPTLTLHRDRAGIGLDDGTQGAGEAPGRSARELLAATMEPDGGGALGFLRLIDIVDATVTIEDEVVGRRWTIPVSDFRLVRGETGLSAEVDVDWRAAGGEAAPVQLTATGRYQGGRWDIGVAFSGVRPALAADFASDLAPLARLDMAIAGTVTLGLDNDASIESAVFDVTTDEGSVNLADAIDGDGQEDGHGQKGGHGQEDGDGVDLLMVTGGHIRGSYQRSDETLHVSVVDLGLKNRALFGKATVQVIGRGRVLPDQRYEVDDALVDFGADGFIRVGAPLDHRFPIRSARLKGSYLGAQDRFVVDGLAADLGGPRLSASATAVGAPPAIRATVAAKLTNLHVNDLPAYWPRALDQGSYDWVTTHLSDGVVPETAVSAVLGTDADGVTVHSLSGSMALAGIAVEYLPPMPPVLDTSGSATFDAEHFTIAIAGGHTEGLKVTGGTIDIDGLSSKHQTAAIDLDIAGPVADVFRLIDKPPLGYASEIGIDPAMVGGDATVRLRLGLPLIDALAMADVDIEAKAKARALLVRDAVLDADLRSDLLTVDLDQDGIDVAGTVRLGALAGRVRGREAFGVRSGVQRRLTVEIANAPVPDVQKTLFGDAADIDAEVDGSLAARVEMTERTDGGGTVVADVDFTATTVAVPAAGWVKGAGEPASAELHGRLSRGQLEEITFAASGGLQPLSLSGSASFEPDNGLRSLRIDNLAYGRTRAGMVLTTLGGDDWEVSVQGRSLDLTPFIEAFDVASLDGASAERGRLRLSADLDTLWMAHDRRLTALSGTAVRNDGLWAPVSVRARVDDGSRLTVTVTDTADRRGRLLVTADDAGATLSSLGLFSDLTGGRLTMSATVGDGEGQPSLDGTLHIRDYHVKDAPLIARLLGMMAISGIDDALRGDGVRFSVLEVPFRLDTGILRIDDARASGTAIGVTASGEVDLPDDRMNLYGTVVPFYLINGALGRIPVLGSVLSGGEKGGGLFAATYKVTGPVEDPDVSVNALATLAPGFLRRLFSGSDPGTAGSGNGSGAGASSP